MFFPAIPPTLQLATKISFMNHDNETMKTLETKWFHSKVLQANKNKLMLVFQIEKSNKLDMFTTSLPPMY